MPAFSLLGTVLNKFQMETDCHNFIFEIMCMHQIYGKYEELPMRLDHVTELRKFVSQYSFFVCLCFTDLEIL